MKSLSRRAFFGTTIAGAAILAIGNPLTAFAAPTSAEKQAEADAVQEKLDAMVGDLEEAIDQYNGCVEAHDLAVAGLAEAQTRIDAAEAKIANLQNHLSTRATTMYRNGSTSFLEVLLGSSSFTEFLTTWDVLNDLNKNDGKLVEETKVARAEAQAAHEEYTVLEADAADKLAAAEEAKATVEEKIAAYETELANLNAEVAELIAQEEAARKAAEEEAARRAAAASNHVYSQTAVYNANTGNAIVDAAYTQLGVDYVWGGTSPYSGLDCSGLTQYCYRQAGIYIPRTSYEQRAQAPGVFSVSDAEPGDILWKSGHVGIYIGGGSFIHAPYTGTVVQISSSMGMWTYALRYS